MTRSGRLSDAASAVRPKLGRAWQIRRGSRRRKAAVHALDRTLRELTAAGRLPDQQWTGQAVVPTETDVTVVLVGPSGKDPRAVARIAEPGADAADLVRNAEVLTALRALPGLGPWREVLPVPLVHGRFGERQVGLEGLVPGASGSAWLGRADRLPALLASAATSIGVLHSATATPAQVDEAVLDAWVEGPLAVLERTLAQSGVVGGTPVPAGLRRELDRVLRGRPFARTWTHGDYWLGNLLVAGGTPDIMGIVDWGAARADGLPLLDLYHLLLTTRAAVDRLSLGQLVAAARERSPWTPAERELLATAAWSWHYGKDDDAALVLTTWLNHVASVLVKRPAYGRDRRWLGNVVLPVLRAM